MMRTTIHKAIRSATFYPLTTFYLATCALLAGVAGGDLDLGIALVLATLTAVLLLLLGTNRRLSTVQTLINYQRIELADSVIERFIEDEGK